MKIRYIHSHHQAVIIVSLLLLPILISACSDTPVDPSDARRPGIQSTFTSTLRVTSTDPTTPARFDTIVAQVEGYLPSYQEKSDVLQYSSSRAGVRYLAYEQNGDLSTFENSVFPVPDTWFPSPAWVRWPFGGDPVAELVLLDTVDAGRGGIRLRTTLGAERSGRRSMKVAGETFQGIGVSYRFTYEIVEEGYVRTIEGSTLYLPDLGWRGEIDEVTTTVVDGDTLSTSTSRTRLVDYVVTSF